MDNEIFNKIATDYREIHKENLKGIGGDSEYYAEYKIKELYDSKQFNDPVKILDLGCGDGLSAKFFQKYFPSSKYYGIDVAKEAVQQAQKTHVGQFQVYNGIEIPFEENEFDLIFVSCVFHHIALEDRTTVIKELKRVLNQNGTLVIFEHNPFNPITQRIVNTCIFDEDAILLNPNALKKQLRKHGFFKVNVRFTLFFPRWKMFKSVHKFERFFSRIPIGGQYYVICTK